MDDGRSAGTVSLDQARYLAEQSGLDLVEISPKAVPPVAKILDYNKYRYQQEKHARQATKPKNELKEIRLGFKINEHDLETMAKRARSFLEQGHFVRAFVVLRGRENIFPDKAKQTLEQFRSKVDAEVEQPVSHIGNKVAVIIKNRKKVNAKD
jgi:translation initiation factor IF-3